MGALSVVLSKWLFLLMLSEFCMCFCKNMILITSAAVLVVWTCYLSSAVYFANNCVCFPHGNEPLFIIAAGEFAVMLESLDLGL